MSASELTSHPCGSTGSSADDESDENSSSSSSSRHKKSESIETLALSPAETAVEHDLDHETEDAMLEFTSGIIRYIRIPNSSVHCFIPPMFLAIQYNIMSIYWFCVYSN